MVEEGRGPKVLESRSPKGPMVNGSKVPKDQDISKSHPNMSLTLKNADLVLVLGLFSFKENNLTDLKLKWFQYNPGNYCLVAHLL